MKKNIINSIGDGADRWELEAVKSGVYCFAPWLTLGLMNVDGPCLARTFGFCKVGPSCGRARMETKSAQRLAQVVCKDRGQGLAA